MLSRRDFIAVAAAWAALAAAGTAGVASAGTQLVRPPGMQGDPAASIDRCIKCDCCRSICPTDCISLATVEDGFFEARTPKMDFHKGLCDFCGKCRTVCPVDAIGSFDSAHDKIGVAVVQTDRCVDYKTGSCSKCQDTCPYDAVHIIDGHPVVDANACNGCGACENACPALVLTSYSGGNRRGIVVMPEQARS